MRKRFWTIYASKTDKSQKLLNYMNVAIVRIRINQIGKKLTKWRAFKNKVLKFLLF